MFKRISRLINVHSGHQQWTQLGGMVVLNDNIHIQGFGDISPQLFRSHDGLGTYKHTPRFLAKNVFVSQCDKNFVFYWMNQRIFPQLENLYLASHPCEPCVLRQDFNIYLTDTYRRYATRWGKNTQIISTDQFKELLAEYHTENISIIPDTDPTNMHIRINREE